MDSFRQVFNYLDKTKCGLVSCEKIGELIRLSGFTPTEAEVITLKGNYAEKTGITFNEYIKLISSLDCVGLLYLVCFISSYRRGGKKGI